MKKNNNSETIETKYPNPREERQTLPDESRSSQ